jgi:hypothetical protein
MPETIIAVDSEGRQVAPDDPRCAAIEVHQPEGMPGVERVYLEVVEAGPR